MPHDTIEPNDEADVMHEQLDYILDHDGSACNSFCDVCRRRRVVKPELMRPFEADPRGVSIASNRAAFAARFGRKW